YHFQIVSTPEAAYRAVLGADGDELCRELAGYVERFSGTPVFLGELRNLLRAHKGNLGVDEAARQLGRSRRSLQRELEAASTSFRDGQARVGRQAVAELWASSDDKLTPAAARIGLTANGLNRLIRERIGTTVDAWRRRLRGE